MAMTSVLRSLFLTFRTAAWSRAALQLEILALRHRANQRPDVGGQGRSPYPTAALPGPPQPEASPVPGNDGVRLHDDERRSPIRPSSARAGPTTVCLREPQPPGPGSFGAPAVDAARPILRVASWRANAPMFAGSGGRTGAPTSLPRSVSIVGREHQQPQQIQTFW